MRRLYHELTIYDGKGIKKATANKVEPNKDMSNAEAFADLLSKMTPRQQEIAFATVRGCTYR